MKEEYIAQIGIYEGVDIEKTFSEVEKLSRAEIIREKGLYAVSALEGMITGVLPLEPWEAKDKEGKDCHCFALCVTDFAHDDKDLTLEELYEKLKKCLEEIDGVIFATVFHVTATDVPLSYSIIKREEELPSYALRGSRKNERRTSGNNL